MSLQSTLLKGVKWTTFDSIITTFIQFLQNVILARLLTPEDFGIMAMIMVLIGFIHPLFDLGLGTAIIQNKEVDTKKLSTLYWLNVFLGFFCFLLAIVFALYSHFFFDQSGLERLIIITSLIFLIAPWGSQYAALIAKELKFELQAKISIICKLMVFLISIGFALTGAGVFALIYAYLFRELFNTGLNIYYGRCFHKPQFYFKLRDVTGMIRFGLFETGSKIVNYFSANIDKFLIGGLLGPHSLGLYTIAWNLVLFPLRKINPIITRITFPLFSKISYNQNLLNKYFQETMILLMIVSFPILLFFAVNAKDILLFLYGDQWLASEEVLCILSLVGFLKSFANPGGSILLSKGRSDIGFYWNIGWSISLYVVIKLFLSVAPTIQAVAMAQLLAGIILGPIWHLLIVYIGKIKYKQLLKQVFILLIFAIPFIFLIQGVDKLLVLPLMPRLVVKIMALGLSYCIFLFVFFKPHLHLLVKAIK